MHSYKTRADFAVGNRVQFTDTDKKLRIYKGNVGTITRLDLSTDPQREGTQHRVGPAGSTGSEGG